MIENTLHHYKQTCTHFKNNRIRLASAFIAGIPLLLTFMLPIKALRLLECPFLTITGLPCPFCGFTRSIWAISAGDWRYATVNCPLSWLFYALLVIVFAWNTGCILLGSKTSRPFILNLHSARANQAVVFSIILILLNWIYRSFLGLT